MVIETDFQIEQLAEQGYLLHTMANGSFTSLCEVKGVQDASLGCKWCVTRFRARSGELLGGSVPEISAYIRDCLDDGQTCGESYTDKFREETGL